MSSGGRQISAGRICLLLLAASMTTAMPSVEPRAIPGTSESNPIKLSMTADGWPDIAEEDCYMLLCLHGGQRVFQRVRTTNEPADNRKTSGAAYRPFAEGRAESNNHIVADASTAEEAPFASTQQGGHDADVMPAPAVQQRSQGGCINSAFRRNKVDFDRGPTSASWFEITAFNNIKYGPYCQAYFAEPQDFSVCDRHTRTTLFGISLDPADFVFKLLQAGIFIHAAGKNKGQKMVVKGDLLPDESYGED